VLRYANCGHLAGLVFLCTDGVTESVNPQDEEFGEARLIEALINCGPQRAPELTQAVLSTVEQFSPGEQFDDITVVAARCTT
jgi:serine phosphatase RsbU (regulator of sigma subunit)